MAPQRRPSSLFDRATASLAQGIGELKDILKTPNETPDEQFERIAQAFRPDEEYEPMPDFLNEDGFMEVSEDEVKDIPEDEIYRVNQTLGLTRHDIPEASALQIGFRAATDVVHQTSVAMINGDFDELTKLGREAYQRGRPIVAAHLGAVKRFLLDDGGIMPAHSPSGRPNPPVPRLRGSIDPDEEAPELAKFVERRSSFSQHENHGRRKSMHDNDADFFTEIPLDGGPSLRPRAARNLEDLRGGETAYLQEFSKASARSSGAAILKPVLESPYLPDRAHDFEDDDLYKSARSKDSIEYDKINPTRAYQAGPFTQQAFMYGNPPRFGARNTTHHPDISFEHATPNRSRSTRRHTSPNSGRPHAPQDHHGRPNLAAVAKGRSYAEVVQIPILINPDTAPDIQSWEPAPTRASLSTTPLKARSARSQPVEKAYRAANIRSTKVHSAQAETDATRRSSAQKTTQELAAAHEEAVSAKKDSRKAITPRRPDQLEPTSAATEDDEDQEALVDAGKGLHAASDNDGELSNDAW